MDVFTGENNWRLTVQVLDGQVAVLRALTCDPIAALPEKLFGLPVTVLGDRALSDAARPVTGREIHITCGAPEREWSNRNIRELTLPATLRTVERYALMNCTQLCRLSLRDGIAAWGAGSIMNCRMLSEIDLTRTGEAYGPSLAFLTASLARELTVRIAGADGESARYVFPEYFEEYEENSPAHHFDLSITGGGYMYRTAFRKYELIPQDYDAMWERFLVTDHEADTALRIAWYRLRFPEKLGNRAENAYSEYIAAHLRETLALVLRENDRKGLERLLSFPGFTKEILSEGQALARDLRRTEAVAVLLEKQYRTFGRPQRKTYEF